MKFKDVQQSYMSDLYHSTSYSGAAGILRSDFFRKSSGDPGGLSTSDSPDYVGKKSDVKFVISRPRVGQKYKLHSVQKSKDREVRVLTSTAVTGAHDVVKEVKFVEKQGDPSFEEFMKTLKEFSKKYGTKYSKMQ